jgi:hypothetical protein
VRYGGEQKSLNNSCRTMFHGPYQGASLPSAVASAIVKYNFQYSSGLESRVVEFVGGIIINEQSPYLALIWPLLVDPQFSSSSAACRIISDVSTNVKVIW